MKRGREGGRGREGRRNEGRAEEREGGKRKTVTYMYMYIQ